MARSDRESLPLVKAAKYVLDECRMVLPGIQTLFGFQLIAVFSPAFDEKLDHSGQTLHFVAIGLVAIAIAMIMTPAAYHRQHRPDVVSERFCKIATRLLVWSMVPLAVSLCLELYLVGGVILDRTIAAVVAGLMFLLFGVLWFVVPRMRTLRVMLTPGERVGQPLPPRTRTSTPSRDPAEVGAP